MLIEIKSRATAHKWNLTSTLPSGHAYKSGAPAFGGWAIERASTGADSIALNMAGQGMNFLKLYL